MGMAYPHSWENENPRAVQSSESEKHGQAGSGEGPRDRFVEGEFLPDGSSRQLVTLVARTSGSKPNVNHVVIMWSGMGFAAEKRWRDCGYDLAWVACGAKQKLENGRTRSLVFVGHAREDLPTCTGCEQWIEAWKKHEEKLLRRKRTHHRVGSRIMLDRGRSAHIVKKQVSVAGTREHTQTLVTWCNKIVKNTEVDAVSEEMGLCRECRRVLG